MRSSSPPGTRVPFSGLGSCISGCPPDDPLFRSSEEVASSEGPEVALGVRGRLGRNRLQEEPEERWVPHPGHGAYRAPARCRRAAQEEHGQSVPSSAKPKFSSGPRGSQKTTPQRRLSVCPGSPSPPSPLGFQSRRKCR